ncbi:glycosyltransferase family 4 protein [Sporosarcina sp. ANT_H38]|uniref:glycosyltransferase family 4 protein n=1 Tax=Sporosarcina sp. ANT_H38 TaxID=2597358 RepID=UPI0011F1D83F|nr:glycosyltransferase family 4 protein [Sporosarcina sp. ANT_H38]KAA0944217.1 glycosyltransferase family 4 protein [Sporosarcina sp. ANT_H38]
MKIVQLITQMDTVGGAQVHVRDIAHGQEKIGHTIYLVAGGNESNHDIFGKDKSNLIYSNYLIRSLHLIWDLKAVFEIRKIIKEIGPDLIATHSSKAGVIGRIAGWTLNIPTIFTAHGWSFTEGVQNKKKWFYILIEKAIGLISDGVITVSKYDEQLALRYKVLPKRKIITIHNGVHDIQVNKKVEYVDRVPKIIMVARFAPPKKQLQLLDALNRIRNIPWEMYFAGEGVQLEEAKNFVEHADLMNRVHFLGNREDINDLLNKSHIFVLLSEWEGLPLSILEAMRSSLPIIASDVGGVKEAVLQSINGYVIPRNDSSDLIDKLTILLTSPELRLEMGNKSRLSYENNFTYDKMQEETLDYYEKVIQTKKNKYL